MVEAVKCYARGDIVTMDGAFNRRFAILRSEVIADEGPGLRTGGELLSMIELDRELSDGDSFGFTSTWGASVQLIKGERVHADELDALEAAGRLRLHALEDDLARWVGALSEVGLRWASRWEQ